MIHKYVFNKITPHKERSYYHWCRKYGSLAGDDREKARHIYFMFHDLFYECMIESEEIDFFGMINKYAGNVFHGWNVTVE